MSKSNGKKNGFSHPGRGCVYLTPEQISALIVEGLGIMKKLPEAPWSRETTPADYKKFTLNRVIAKEPWRDGCAPGNKGGNRLFDDICKVSGGQLPRAESITDFIVFARNNLHPLLLAMRRLQKATPDELYQIELGKFNDEKSHRIFEFFEKIAEAFEVLGFKKNDFGTHPGDRIIGSDRRDKADLLRRLADTLDPVNDEARLRKLHWRERVPANGLPTEKNFRDVFPESLREALELEIDVDEEMEMHYLDWLAGRRYNVPVACVRGMVLAKQAMGAAWRDERFEYPPGEPGQTLEERADEIREWQHDNIASVQELAKLFISDPDWLRETESTVNVLVDKVMAKPESGNLFLDVAHTCIDD